MVEKAYRCIEKEKFLEMRIIAIVGPTASGKTGRAVSVARAFDGEIISGDSRQVYRDMDLGTGKDIEEYNGIPYHLIDICDAGEKYNLHRYLSDFRRSLDDIENRGKQPVLCGGSGMYIEAALSGIIMPEVPVNPVLRERFSETPKSLLTEILKGYKTLHNSTDIDSRERIIRAIEIEEYYLLHPDEAMKSDRSLSKPLDSVLIGIDIPREERRKRISFRLQQRLDNGMVEEVKTLLGRGIVPEDLIYYGLEYKYLTLHVTGFLTYEEMKRQLEIAIHQFAKRQMTWLRGMERRGFKINWLPYDLSPDDFVEEVRRIKNI